MAGLLFVSQAVLESWVEQGKVEFRGNLLTLLAGEGRGRSYALDPAVRFVKVLGAERDPNGLVARVKTDAQLRQLGAERLEDSVVLGEVAYEVQPGFLADGSTPRAAPPARPGPPRNGAEAGGGLVAGSPMGQPGSGRAEPLPRDLEEKRKEAEALARFLLENLS